MMRKKKFYGYFVCVYVLVEVHLISGKIFLEDEYLSVFLTVFSAFNFCSVSKESIFEFAHDDYGRTL